MKLSLASFIIAIILCGCAANSTEMTWKDTTMPEATINKLLVIYVNPMNVANRKVLETEVVFRLEDMGYQALASSRFLDVFTKEKVISLMDEQGFDGALVIRLKDITYEERYDPKQQGNTTGAPDENAFFKSMDARGYNDTSTEQVIIVESRLFQRRDTKLLGVIESKTLSLHTVDEIIEDYAKALANSLHKSKLLTKKAEK